MLQKVKPQNIQENNKRKEEKEKKEKNSSRTTKVTYNMKITNMI